MIITICSSVDFTPKIIEVKKELEDMGHKINILYFTQMIINRELFYEDYLKIKKLPKISLSPQQATEYSLRNFSLSATSNFSLSKSATASCGVLNPDLEIKEKGEDILLRNKQPVDMIKRYWNFIKDSDAILVLNLEKKGIKSYIGGNTLIEMGFAYCHNKKIYLFNSIPERSEKMYYVDEIIDMKPIVINSDLTKIPTAI